MHPDIDYLGSLDGGDAGTGESDTFDPYLISAVSASQQQGKRPKLSENMEIVVLDIVVDTFKGGRTELFLASQRRSVDFDIYSLEGMTL